MKSKKVYRELPFKGIYCPFESGISVWGKIIDNLEAMLRRKR